MPIISNKDRRASEQRAREMAQAERRPGETVAQAIHRLEEERRQLYAAAACALRPTGSGWTGSTPPVPGFDWCKPHPLSAPFRTPSHNDLL